MHRKSVSVLDFGAIAGSKEVQTKCFQDAIDSCFLAGGGEITVPEGEFIIGDIRLRSNTTLHLLENAKILGSSDPKDYTNIYEDTVEPLPEDQATKVRWVFPHEWAKMGGGFKPHLYTAGSYWNYGLIRAAFAENIAVIGEKGSVIDGRNVFDQEGEEHYRGPHGINMHFCKNVRFDGYTITNTGNWAHAIFQSSNVSFTNLTVLAGHDALHTRACTNVIMDNCKLITGDDAIAGFNNINVRISNCEISSACSAFRFGGYNVLIENCEVYGPCKYQFRGGFTWDEKVSGATVSSVARNNMLCFFTNFVSDDLPLVVPAGNIKIRNCNVKGADRFLHLNLSGNESWQRGNPPTDITFENITAKDIATGLYAYGDGEVHFDLTLKNVEYSYREGHEKDPFIKAAHFGDITLDNVKVSNYEGNAFIKCWSEGGNIITNNLDCDIKDGELRVQAEEKFVCNPI